MNCENERGKERKTVWRVKRWISFNGSTSLAPLNHDVTTLRTMPMSSRLTFKGKNYFKISLFPPYLPWNYNTHTCIVSYPVFSIHYAFMTFAFERKVSCGVITVDSYVCEFQ